MVTDEFQLAFAKDFARELSRSSVLLECRKIEKLYEIAYSQMRMRDRKVLGERGLKPSGRTAHFDPMEKS